MDPNFWEHDKQLPKRAFIAELEASDGLKLILSDLQSAQERMIAAAEKSHAEDRERLGVVVGEIKRVVAAVAGLPDPIVNVSAPVVNIPKPDPVNVQVEAPVVNVSAPVVQNAAPVVNLTPLSVRSWTFVHTYDHLGNLIKTVATPE